jgi:arginine exporter protein ArgO
VIARALTAGVVAGFAVAVPLGAIGVLIIATAAQHGRRAGLAAATAVATADGLFAVVAAIGGAAAAELIRPYADIARIVAGIVLLGVAAFGARAALRPQLAAEPLPASSIYPRFLALTLINPLTVLAFAAVVLALPPGTVATTGGKAAFVAGVAAASMAWQAVLALGGVALGKMLGPRARLVTGLTGSALVAVLAVVTLLR